MKFKKWSDCYKMRRVKAWKKLALFTKEINRCIVLENCDRIMNFAQLLTKLHVLLYSNITNTCSTVVNRTFLYVASERSCWTKHCIFCAFSNQALFHSLLNFRSNHTCQTNLTNLINTWISKTSVLLDTLYLFTIVAMLGTRIFV